MQGQEAQIRTLGQWHINWSWFVRMECHTDGTVTIQRHWREHETVDPLTPEAVDAERIPYRLIERGEWGDDQTCRDVVAVWFDNAEHPVRNVQNVFSYKG